MSEIVTAGLWWAVIQAFGFSALPLAYRLLRWLPDRGYAVSKALGVLLVSYVFWLLNTLGFLQNSAGSILLAAAGVIAISIWIYRRGADDPEDEGLFRWLRNHLRLILSVEALFLLAFAGWAIFRAHNPEITGTEKPMDLAFINAVARSDHFPPLDPWLSGFAISYYYFGYLIISTIAQVIAVPGQIAFNLGLAWQFAGTFIGAFGLVYNLVAAVRKGRPGLRIPVGYGLLGGTLVALMGNLEGLLEVLHVNAILPAAFWRWLDIQDLSTVLPGTAGWPPRFWWWWRASRVITDLDLSGTPIGLQPIDEFPFFSFLLGDMHPHVLTLPFVLLALGLALNWWLKRWPAGGENGAGLWHRVRQLVQAADPAHLGVYVVCLGALGFLNTWDFPIYLFLVVGAVTLSRTRIRDRFDAGLLIDALILGAGLLVAGLFAYLPFYIGFRSQAAGFLPNVINPTRFSQFFVMFGPFLFLLGIWLLDQGRRARPSWRTAVAASGGLLAMLVLVALVLGGAAILSPQVQGVLGQVTAEVGGAQAAFWQAIRIRLSNPWTTLFLLAIIGVVIALWRAFLVPDRPGRNPEPGPRDVEPERTVSPFVLLLVLTAALLTLAPDYVYLRDNFGARLNTVFKFYYQAWVLFGLASAFGLYSLLRSSRPVRWVAGAGGALLIAAGLVYPVLAIPTRAGEYSGAATLDGMAYMEQVTPGDYAAIRWLQDNATGAPVVLEAVGGQYSRGGRIAAHTGLPTVLGWAGHEYQWRGETPEPAERETDIKTAYTSASWSETEAILDRYAVKYVVVGSLETSTYGEAPGIKFARMLEPVFQADGVTIYEWNTRTN
jgi:YYY domain-containing protein